MKKYGRNWEKVAEAVGTRSLDGVRTRFKLMKDKADNFLYQHFPDIAFPPPPSTWTIDEQNKLVTAFKKHGNNYAKITEAVGSKTVVQVNHYTEALKQKIELNPGHKHADILPILQEQATT